MFKVFPVGNTNSQVNSSFARFGVILQNTFKHFFVRDVDDLPGKISDNGISQVQVLDKTKLVVGPDQIPRFAGLPYSQQQTGQKIFSQVLKSKAYGQADDSDTCQQGQYRFLQTDKLQSDEKADRNNSDLD